MESVRFKDAVLDSLEARKERRPRTLTEIRSVCNGIMKRMPELSARPVHTITRADCARIVNLGATRRQKHKIRTILHGVFEHCWRQEWCLSNPVSLLRVAPLQEKAIHPLAWEDLLRLLRKARQQPHRECMAALGLMLWAGVRPAEVTRLKWSDIDWEESVVILQPRHSKTGGCRHVQLRPVLVKWLQEYGPGKGGICPPNWQRRWRRLRDASGVSPWTQDVLRHTFASYHAKHFHDFTSLQIDMGHRSAELLRTRYLSMQGVTSAQARLFWEPGAL